jgi:hypothetical protein
MDRCLDLRFLLADSLAAISPEKNRALGRLPDLDPAVFEA